MAGMSGSITPRTRKDGTTVYLVRLTIDGARETLGTYDSLDDARQTLAAALAEFGPPTRRVMTLDRYMPRWLDGRELDGQRSIEQQRSLYRRHIEGTALATLPLRRLRRGHVVRWTKELGRKRATEVRHHRGTQQTELVETGRRLSRAVVVHALNLVRRALTDAADEGLLDQNPAMGVRIPPQPTTREGWTFLSLDEIGAALSAELTPMQLSAFTVAIYAGLRAGELWGLRWNDVHLSGPQPRLVVRHSYRGPTKGGRVREVPLLPLAVEALRVWREERPGIGDALVWPAAGGGCHARGYDAGWPRVARMLGRRVRLHDLRHTCASHLVMGSWTRAPLTLLQVAAVLGHASPQTSAIYAHLAPGNIHDAVTSRDLQPEKVKR